MKKRALIFILMFISFASIDAYAKNDVVNDKTDSIELVYRCDKTESNLLVTIVDGEKYFVSCVDKSKNTAEENLGISAEDIANISVLKKSSDSNWEKEVSAFPKIASRVNSIIKYTTK